MKIALVSPYDFVFPGGVTNHISSLEHHFTEMGHQVKVIAPASKAVSTFGDRFIPIGKPRPIPTSGSIARITISLRLASAIKAVLDEEKFDIIHLHEPFMPMLCSAVLRFSDTTNIGTFHACYGSPGYKFGRPISTMLLKRRGRNLDGKIAVSKSAMEYASKYVPGDYDIIPNGIDVNRFNPGVAPFEEYCDGKKNILFVGRLEYRKGLNYLLKAYLQLKPKLPDSRLIVVGPGTRLYKRYQKWVNRHNLPDVVFVGYAPFEELPRYYQTADVFCAPAISQESFGIVLLEAMAVGKPIVATDIEGYAGVVSHGQDGLLVPPCNAKELADTLIHVLSDEKVRQALGANGRLKAVEYNWEQIAERVLDYYHQVLDQSPKRR